MPRTKTWVVREKWGAVKTKCSETFWNEARESSVGRDSARSRAHAPILKAAAVFQFRDLCKFGHHERVFVAFTL